MIGRIQYAVGKPEVFDMVLLWKKVKNPEEILDGYWEYYQRSRVKKAPRPSLYIHSAKYAAGNNCTLKVYDKARELAQSRVLTRAWNGMKDKIQRMEISVENKQFKRFFQHICAANPDRWLFHNPSSTTREQKQEEYRKGLEHFFFDLGMNETLREEMFDYFSNHLLHFKLRTHEKTQVSILDLSLNSLATLRRVANKKKGKDENRKREKENKKGTIYKLSKNLYNLLILLWFPTVLLKMKSRRELGFWVWRVNALAPRRSINIVNPMDNRYIIPNKKRLGFYATFYVTIKNKPPCRYLQSGFRVPRAGIEITNECERR